MLDWIFEKIPFTSVILSLLLIVLTLGITYSKFRYYFQVGPWGIPLLGFYPFLREDFHIHLTELAKKYGDAYLFSMGGNKCLHVGNHKLLREVFITNADCFQHRHQGFSVLGHLFKNGMVFIEAGTPWKVWRKFLVQSMRELGINPNELKGPLLDSVQNTLQALKDCNEQPIDLGDLLTFHCTETVRRLMLGDDLSKENAAKLNKLYCGANIIVSQKELILAGNAAKYLIVPLANGYKELINGRRELNKMFQNLINEHRKKFQSDNLNDLIDLYLNEKNIREKQKDGTAQYFNDKAFIGTLLQVYGDGGFAIGAFITSFLKLIASKLDLQEAIYKEIVQEIGTERVPVYEDRKKLPFTSSVLLEIERQSIFFPIVPTSVASYDVTISGIFVPKGTTAVVNQYAIHNQPNAYKNPDEFVPDRFLVDKSTNRPSVEMPVTFGIGKRACAGETIVRLELFAFFVSILQHFTIHKVPKSSHHPQKKGIEFVDIMEERFIAKPREH